MRMLGHALDIAANDEAIALDNETEAHRAALARHAEADRLVRPADLREGAEHVITGQRQEGKTYLAMRWLLGAPDGVQRVLIVRDRWMADHLRLSWGMKRNDPRVIAWRQLAGMNRPLEAVEYGVDETLDILADLLGVRTLPHLVTIATEPRDLS